jgi:hypothetical protein
MIGVVGLSLVLALLIFQAGVFVGYKKAAFSRQLGNNFYRVFDDPASGFRGKVAARFSDGLPGGHGATGFIASVSSSSMVVVGPDGVEKFVVMDGGTDVRRARSTVDTSDLREGDFVVTLGSPDDQGKIRARLIRVLPPPPSEIK